MRTIIALLFTVICASSFAQNTYRFSQFNLAKSLYNPAALATDASYSADLIYRNQWAGIDGAPSTFGFNAAYELMEEMAVGINFYSDKIGLTQTNSFTAQYSYRLLFDKRKYLAFGLGIGGDNYSSNLGAATVIEANDPAFAQSYSKFRVNGSFGMYYRSSNFYAGFSIPQLFQNSSTKISDTRNVERWHYNFISGYFIEVSDNFIFNPNVQIKATWNAPIQGDLVLRGISNNLGFSLGYRTENSLILGMDFMFARKVRVGYAFNHDFGSLARVKGMSHEICLGLALPYYFNGDGFDRPKYIGRKGGMKMDYSRRYQRLKRRNR